MVPTQNHLRGLLEGANTEEDSSVEGFSAWHNAILDWHLDVVDSVLCVLVVPPRAVVN